MSEATTRFISTYAGTVRRSFPRRVYGMTEIAEVNINEALALIDQGLGLTMSRELMSTTEVADLLLDVRSILAAAPTDEVLEEPVPAAVQ